MPLMPVSDSVTHPPLLDSIIQSSRRWQQFELGIVPPGSDVLTRLLSLSSDDLCMLRELRIHSFYSTVHPHTQEDLLWYRSGLLTAQGLRSLSIADSDMRQINAFPTSIPPNWKNLNHLFIHSQISLGPAHSILSYCCNLIACLLEIGSSWYGIDGIPDAFITLSSCILPHLTALSVQGDLDDCSKLFGSIEAPSLQILDYQGYFPSEFEEFGLLNLLQSVDSLKTLSVDQLYLTESNLLKYCTLIPSVTHLILGRSPNRSYKLFIPPGHISQPPYPKNVTLMTTLHEIRHQYSPNSAPTVLFPSLEIFEVYDVSGVADIMLLEFIKGRIDAATESNTAGVSKLKKVLVEFEGMRQTDIVPEALAYAEAAGITLKLDLTYHTTGKELNVTWSPSFGLSSDDVSWVHPLYYSWCNTKD